MARGLGRQPRGGDTDRTTASTGSLDACAAHSGGVHRWGDGEGASPARVGAGSDWWHVTAARHHASGLRGALGDGTFTDRTTPTRVGGDSDWTALAVAFEQTCGLRAGGTLHCWGDGEGLTLGDGGAVATLPRSVD